MLDSKNTDMSYTVPLMSACLGKRDKIISFLTRNDLTREAQAFFVSDHLGPIPLNHILSLPLWCWKEAQKDESIDPQPILLKACGITELSYSAG